MTKIFQILLILLAGFQLSACALAVGAGAAVVVDEIVEDERGGDGLF